MTHPMSHHDKVAKSIDFDLARSGTISNQPHEFPEIFGVPKFATNLGGPQSPPRWGNLLRWRPRDTHTTLAIEGPGGVMPLETRVTVTRGLLIRSVHWPPQKKIVGDFIIAKRWFFHVGEGFCGFFCRGKFRENRSNLLPKNEVPKKQTNLGGKPQVETPDQSYHGVSWRNKKDAIRKIFHSRMWRRMVDWGFQKDVWIVGWLVICDFFPEIQRTSSGKG